MSLLEKRGLSNCEAMAQLQALREGGGSIPRFEDAPQFAGRLCGNLVANMEERRQGTLQGRPSGTLQGRPSQPPQEGAREG